MYTPNDLSEKAIQKFLADNKDLLPLVKISIDELRRKMSAAMQLNPEFTEEILMHADSDYLNQPGHAGRVARESFQNAMYVAVCRCFLKVQHNLGVIYAVSGADFPEAFAQLDAILVAVGEKQATPPPPPPRSSEEILEEQVREDWRKLPSDKLKIKLQRDPQYKQVFDRLMASNQLDSIATSYTDGSAGFGQ